MLIKKVLSYIGSRLNKGKCVACTIRKNNWRFNFGLSGDYVTNGDKKIPLSNNEKESNTMNEKYKPDSGESIAKTGKKYTNNTDNEPTYVSNGGRYEAVAASSQYPNSYKGVGQVYSSDASNNGKYDTMVLYHMLYGQGKMEETKAGCVRESNAGRGRFDLIPYEALEAMAKWYEAGAEKYGERNWEKGISVKDCINRMCRHALKVANGWTDEDHLAAVMWNAAAAITMMQRKPECNDHVWHGLECKEPGATLYADEQPIFTESQKEIKIPEGVKIHSDDIAALEKAGLELHEAIEDAKKEIYNALMNKYSVEKGGDRI